ncbi:hypothetical protein HED50_02440 [Ochrobactrum oryzae]|nr:hypothetical protein [Brucella oryzae]
MLLPDEICRRITSCGGLEHNPTGVKRGSKHALSVPEFGPVQGSQDERSTESRRPIDEMDVMGHKSSPSFSGVAAILPRSDPNICFIAFSCAKPLRTFAGNALNSAAG